MGKSQISSKYRHRAMRGGSIRYTLNVNSGGRSGAPHFVARVWSKGKTCATGKNPRAALSSALTKYARQVKARRGAFKGLR